MAPELPPDASVQASSRVGGALLLLVAALAAAAWLAPRAPDLHPTIAAEARSSVPAGLIASAALFAAGLGWLRGRPFAPYLALPCGALQFTLGVLFLITGAGVTSSGALLPAQLLLFAAAATGVPLAAASLARVVAPLSRVSLGPVESRALAALLALAAALLFYIWGRFTWIHLTTGANPHPYVQAGAPELFWMLALLDTGFAGALYLAAAWLLLRGGRAAAPAGFLGAAWLAQNLGQAVSIEAHRLATGQPWTPALLIASTALSSAAAWAAASIARRAIGAPPPGQPT